MAAYHSPNQEPPGSYMDGIRVKISEKYKPPPKIGLPMTYSQRLSLNKQIHDTIPAYEFILEKTVIEKLKQWKSARSVQFSELNERLAKAKQKNKQDLEERSQRNDEDETEIATSTTPLYVNSGPNQAYQQTHSMLIPTQAATILTPMPLNEQTLNNFTNSNDKSPFNISDFEADTSSPFDNMELKSMNDMEELAQVLKSDPNTLQKHSSYSMGGATYNYSSPKANYAPPVSYSGNNGYYYSPESTGIHYSFGQNSSGSNVDLKNTTYNNVPDIIKSLQIELDNTHLDNIKNKGCYPKMKTKNEELFEDFNSLPKAVQDMSKAISSMGFPLNRVARVCKILGSDQKKVVEHLLAMSELLDLGFPESTVSKALLECDNDRDKALDILIS